MKVRIHGVTHLCTNADLETLVEVTDCLVAWRTRDFNSRWPRGAMVEDHEPIDCMSCLALGAS